MLLQVVDVNPPSWRRSFRRWLSGKLWGCSQWVAPPKREMTDVELAARMKHYTRRMASAASIPILEMNKLREGSNA